MTAFYRENNRISMVHFRVVFVSATMIFCKGMEFLVIEIISEGKTELHREAQCRWTGRNRRKERRRQNDRNRQTERQFTRSSG